MKLIILMLYVLFCSNVFAQQSDSAIAILKNEIIGTWIYQKTICKDAPPQAPAYKEQFTFKLKKVTVTIICGNKKVSRSYPYQITTKYYEEEKRDILVIKFGGNKKISYWDNDPCEDMRLNYFALFDFLTPVIDNNTLTVLREMDKDCYDTLKKELKTKH